MSKQLRIWLFVLLSTLLASTTLPAQGVITMITSQRVGEEIGLIINANGNVTIEGVKETFDYDTYTYTLTSQTITIRGDVTELYCDGNQLTSLDVSKNTALTELTCIDNQLTSLNVSKNTALTKLDCSNNKLTSLNVSNNSALTALYCSVNQLTNLNVSGCARLNTLYCYSNFIKGKAMTKLVNSLPNRRKKKSGNLLVVDRYGYSNKKDKNRYSAADVATAKRKNWELR